jgi:glycogen operon protein
MLVSGDETGRTQQGNNNAYCQDNELSWVNWTLSRSARAQLGFTQRLIRLRLGHPVFHRRLFFQGRRIEGSEVKDLSWFRPDGKEMTEEEWKNGFTRCLGLRLAGDAIEEVDNAGNPIRDDTFLLLLNAHHEPIEFVLPAHRARLRWNLVLDTRDWTPGTGAFRAGDAYSLEARSLALLRLRGPRDAP